MNGEREAFVAAVGLAQHSFLPNAGHQKPNRRHPGNQLTAMSPFAVLSGALASNASSSQQMQQN
jgi:hypothetical protein